MAGTTGLNETLLGAIRTHMNGVPRDVAPAGAIGMSKHRLVIRTIGSPIIAGGIYTGREGTALRIGTRKNVMFVRHVAGAMNHIAVLVQRRSFLDIVPVALVVAVQIRDICSDQRALGIVPGPRPDSAARIHAELL